MVIFLIFIFFVQLIAILDYLYHPKDSQLSRIPYKYAKLSYISTICMVGGLSFILIIELFDGYVSTNSNNETYGNFGIRSFEHVFRDYNLGNFFYGYFITLLIIFLKNCKDKFKL